jgi:hypothetical protein
MDGGPSVHASGELVRATSIGDFTMFHVVAQPREIENGKMPWDLVYLEDCRVVRIMACHFNQAQHNGITVEASLPVYIGEKTRIQNCANDAIHCGGNCELELDCVELSITGRHNLLWDRTLDADPNRQLYIRNTIFDFSESSQLVVAPDSTSGTGYIHIVGSTFASTGFDFNGAGEPFEADAHASPLDVSDGPVYVKSCRMGNSSGTGIRASAGQVVIQSNEFTACGSGSAGGHGVELLPGVANVVIQSNTMRRVGAAGVGYGLVVGGSPTRLDVSDLLVQGAAQGEIDDPSGLLDIRICIGDERNTLATSVLDSACLLKRDNDGSVTLQLQAGRSADQNRSIEFLDRNGVVVYRIRCESNHALQIMQGSQMVAQIQPSAPADTLRIDERGDVGINRTRPTEKLEVGGNVMAHEPGDAGVSMILRAGSTAEQNRDLAYRTRSGTEKWNLRCDADSRLSWIRDGSETVMRMDVSAQVDALHLDASGVGVGGASASDGTNELTLHSGVEPGAGGANRIHLYSVDASAGNTILGIRAEGSQMVEATGGDTHTHRILMKINGTVYKLLAVK